MHKCVLDILCNTPISVLTIDYENDVILAGLDHLIHIYDVQTGRLLAWYLTLAAVDSEHHRWSNAIWPPSR